MKVKPYKLLTREKHLDHMVKVVPFIVFGYAAQSFVVLQISPNEFSSTCLTVLGSLLTVMIAAFITYDLKHSVKLGERELAISFLGFRKSVKYTEILTVEIQEPSQRFSNLTIYTSQKKYIFYFIDDADKIKDCLEQKNDSILKAA
jgi:hypothetical protein